ncbi:UNVERIFIED_CONTAM: hypothetical protein RMT77_002240 [Armadillidium vulgare]
MFNKNKNSLIYMDEENRENDNFQSSSSSSEETNQSEEDIKDERSDEAQNSKCRLMDNFMNNYIAILYELCKDPNMREGFSKFVDYFIHLVNKRKLKMLKSTSELESPNQTSEHKPTMSSILSGLQCSAKDYPKTYLDLFYETLRIFNVYEVSREMKLFSFLLWDRYKQDFEEICLIDSGGFGEVYRVRHKLDCQEYAVKKIYMGQLPLSESALATLEEVKLLSQMNHPNVAKYYNSWIQYSSHEPFVEATDEQYHMSFTSQRIEISSSSSSGIMFQNSEKVSQNNSPHKYLSYNNTKFMSKSEKYAVNTPSSLIPPGETYESSFNSTVSEEKCSKSSQSETSSHRNENNDERSLLPFQSHEIVSPQYLMLFIQMELGKENLRDWIENRNKKLYDNKKSKLDNAEIKNHFRIFREICLAIEYIHSKGIMHRDIKPANILITFDEQILLADFGLAKMCHDKGKPKIGTDVGTPPYDAPEIEEEFYNNKVDIYSLGIVLFELLEPFYTSTEKEKAIAALRNRKESDKPVTKCKNLNKLLIKMIEKDPDLRPSASEIVSELSEIGKLLDPSTSQWSSKNAPVLSANNCSNNEINVASNPSLLPSSDSVNISVTLIFSRVGRYLSKYKGLDFKSKTLQTQYKTKEIKYFLNKKFENKLKGKNFEIKKMKSKIKDLESRIEILEKLFNQ